MLLPSRCPTSRNSRSLGSRTSCRRLQPLLERVLALLPVPVVCLRMLLRTRLMKGQCFWVWARGGLFRFVDVSLEQRATKARGRPSDRSRKKVDRRLQKMTRSRMKHTLRTMRQLIGGNNGGR